jgi:hypothetical protein
MSSILDTLQQHLGPDTIQQLSQSIGADPSATSSAVSMALPALVGALSNNAATPEGAASLDRALDAHDGGILDNLGGLFGGGGSAAGGIGGAILGHILGSRRGPVESGVAKASGLDMQQVARLMTMLAPIVMGVLGRMKQQKQIDANQLPEVLGQSRAQVEAIPGLGGLLDANHDGSIADDIMRMGSSALGGLFGEKKS